MVGDSQPVLVLAIYSFKGKNNDELCFKKGDIITITQREEGGWWEGTLAEKTGWFPSNYVKEHKLQDSTSLASSPTTSALPVDLATQQKGYRNVVLKEIIDSEKANVAELQALLKNFLHPLEKSDILTREEYRQLVGNIGHVVETHQQLLSALEECNLKAAPDQRVGKVFLAAAPRVKQVHQAYCAAHPKAVCILEKYKEELNAFMEQAGAASPGLLVLTTGLSKPFRRLEKYAGMLQELERHLEENHPDRGDTQRSTSVYKDVASSCSGVRRQKQLELEVLTGGVRGWEGEELSLLGEILHMGSVAVGPEHRDRYLVLFSTTLLVLSVSPRMSAFIYEGKLPLTGISVERLQDSDQYKNAFEITGPMIERILAICQTREDQHTWVDKLKQLIRSSAPSPPPTSHTGLIRAANRGWSGSCLRPSPPLRPCLALGRDDTIRRSARSSTKSNGVERSFEEDGQILRVIEAYCTSTKSRYTVNSVREVGDGLVTDGDGVWLDRRVNHVCWFLGLLDNPQVLVAEDEKIIVEENSGNSTIVEEKSLVDTVYGLKDQVRLLQDRMVAMSIRQEEEVKERKNLQNIIRLHFGNTVKEDISWSSQ